MAKVVIVGAGYMGTAMCWPLVDNGHAVRLVGTHLDREIIVACRDRHWHPKLQRELPGGVEAFFVEDLSAAMQGAELVIQGVSSPGAGWFARTLAPFLGDRLPVLSITKGLALADDGRLQILPDYIDSLLPARVRGRIPLAAVGGPCIAGELAARRPSCVVFTGRDASLLARLATMLRTDYYHIWTSTDVLGVETCVALKNGYSLGVALALGVLDAQGGPDTAGAHMHNLAAALFAQAGFEMTRIVQLMGGDIRAVTNLPGIGDMFVTVQGGRSVAIGRLLGAGVSIRSALERLAGVTLESVDVIRTVCRALPGWEREGRLGPEELPLMRHLGEVIVHDRPINLPLPSFFGGRG